MTCKYVQNTAINKEPNLYEQYYALTINGHIHSLAPSSVIILSYTVNVVY